MARWSAAWPRRRPVPRPPPCWPNGCAARAAPAAGPACLGACQRGPACCMGGASRPRRAGPCLLAVPVQAERVRKEQRTAQLTAEAQVGGESNCRAPLYCFFPCSARKGCTPAMSASGTALHLPAAALPSTTAPPPAARAGGDASRVGGATCGAGRRTGQVPWALTEPSMPEPDAFRPE